MRFAGAYRGVHTIVREVDGSTEWSINSWQYEMERVGGGGKEETQRRQGVKKALQNHGELVEGR